MPNPLEQIIINEISENGPMDVGTFMTYALSHPQHGYYCKVNPFQGGEYCATAPSIPDQIKTILNINDRQNRRQGDFITSPELSQMFGEMIGAWVCDVWMQMGCPKPFALVEFGPGRGLLMHDIVRATKAVKEFHDAMQIHFVEINAVLRDLQAKKLKPYKPQHHDDITSLPDDMPLLCVANEFLDALPIRQYQYNAGHWQERVVSFNGDDSFQWGLRPTEANPPQIKYMDNMTFNDGDILEVSDPQTGWLSTVSERLKRQDGIFLTFDYGYDKPGTGDTFQAVQNHTRVDVFDDVGNVDLTSQIDFHCIKHHLEGEGAMVHGPVTQGDFLKYLGIEQRAAILCRNANDSQQHDIETVLRLLIAPDKMGDLFKVIAVMHNTSIKPVGFDR